MPELGKFSLQNLATLHPDLKKLVRKVAESVNIQVTCGYRGKADQEKAFEDGFSKAHFGQSPHNYDPALAVDIVPYPEKWSNEKKLKELGAFVKITAIDLGIDIVWGGDWKNFPDLPHYELKDWQKIKK